jgi:hypothetical protein
MRKYTQNAKKALYESLKSQKSKKTPAENKLYNLLREELSEVINGLLVLDGYAKQRNLDTFGDKWRNGWVKIKEDQFGEYIRTVYLGKHYLNGNDQRAYNRSKKK